MLWITTLATEPTTTITTTTIAQLCPLYILSIVHPVHCAFCQSRILRNHHITTSCHAAAATTTTATTTVAKPRPSYILSILHPVNCTSCQSHILSITHSARSPRYYILPLLPQLPLPLQLLAPVNHAFWRSRTCQLGILLITHPAPSAPSPITTAITAATSTATINYRSHYKAQSIAFAPY